MTDQLWIARITPVALRYLSSWDYRGPFTAESRRRRCDDSAK
jgi:hypothetical protein